MRLSTIFSLILLFCNNSFAQVKIIGNTQTFDPKMFAEKVTIQEQYIGALQTSNADLVRQVQDLNRIVISLQSAIADLKNTVKSFYTSFQQHNHYSNIPFWPTGIGVCQANAGAVLQGRPSTQSEQGTTTPFINNMPIIAFPLNSLGH